MKNLEYDSYFDTLLKLTDDIILILDQNERVLRINEIGENELNLDLKKNGDERFFDIFNQKKHVLELRERIRSNEIVKSRLNFITEIGEVKVYEIQIRKHNLKQSDTFHWLIILKNITHHRAIEKELEQSHLRYRNIVETQTEFIVRWKPDGVRTFVNEAYCKFFGLTKEEAIGTSFFPFVSEEFMTDVKERIFKLKPENPISSGEHEIIKSDGSKGWNYWTDRAFFDEEGKVIEYQSVGIDITERKKAERLLSEVKKFQEIGKMAGGVAHDLNNIFTSIINYNTILEDLTDNQEILEIMKIQENALKMGQYLVYNLMTLSKSTNKELTTFKSFEIISSILQLLNKQIIEKNIVIKTNLDKDTSILGNSGQFTQIVINIIVNSIDAIPKDGLITISSKKYNEYLIFEVEDNGTGIKKENLEKLTQFLFTTKHNGSGIGLFVTQKLLFGIGGSLNIDSTYGEGTKVKINFPLDWKK